MKLKLEQSEKELKIDAKAKAELNAGLMLFDEIV